MSEKIKILIPHRLPELLKKNRQLQRITATFLLLKALNPSGRFLHCSAAVKEMATACGFKSKRGFTNHLDKLKSEGLIKYRYHEGHNANYIELASWDQVKKHFDYERNYFKTYQVEVITANDVLGILIQLACAAEEKFFDQCYHLNLRNNPDLKQIVETVCGSTRKADILHSQLHYITKGVPKGLDDDTYYSIYMLLHATKQAKGAGEEKSKRFYFKADTNVSTGYLSGSFGYARKNGFCYWKKKLQRKGLLICNRREYVIDCNVRTTTEARNTGIGNIYYDPSIRRLKLRLVDEMIFRSPEACFTLEAQMWRNEVENLGAEVPAKTEKI